MHEMTLFHCPPACSRITMVALEETGLPYRETVVRLMQGEQHAPDYLAINPKGKVPALRVGDAVLTENPVIIHYLHTLAPQAGLLPASDDPVQRSQYLADLVWASSGLHTGILRQVTAPFRLTAGDTTGLKSMGLTLLADQAASISARLAAGGWWYGNTWSMLDVYVTWVFMSAQQVGGFDLARFPQLVEHGERVRARPAFQRTLSREKEILDRAGIKMPGAPVTAPAPVAANG